MDCHTSTLCVAATDAPRNNNAGGDNTLDVFCALYNRPHKKHGVFSDDVWLRKKTNPALACRKQAPEFFIAKFIFFTRFL